MRRNWILIVTALFAFGWLVYRACVQSITLDEANTYHLWVARHAPTHWEPHSNNHVLNSTLMRASIWIFGLSHLSLRLPALVGAALYIFASYRLCTLLAGSLWFRWALFTCFVYNPFVMDYLVAARGYGLALGLLAMAIFLFSELMLQECKSGLGQLAAVSVLVSLAVCASFTFAYAGAFLLAATALSAYSKTTQSRDLRSLLRLGAATALPALLTLMIFAGSALTRFPRTQMFWGSESLLATWGDIRDACFTELNPHLVNPLLAAVLDFFHRHLFQALAAVAIGYVVLLGRANVKSWELPARRRLLLSVSLAAVLIVTVAAHWLQYRLFQIPLPYERTAIFVVPLATAFFGATLAIRPWNKPSAMVRSFAIGLLLVSGFYFLGELRAGYFREWRIGAETRAAFPVLLELCRRNGIRDVTSDPNLTGSLNFYRELYQVRDLDHVKYFEDVPPGGKIYVVPESRAGDLLRKEPLTVAWRGPVSDLLILVPAATGR